ncbi:unnamed protein product [Gemmata massiliana]|uniref:Uncharacterized protein n=1 Tax=Gemmata massiliana TaxID=1210884 RepID=A0A6P2DJI4_9BACT|nr:unnamed protein product [Gemmata massiliana]
MQAGGKLITIAAAREVADDDRTTGRRHSQNRIWSRSPVVIVVFTLIVLGVATWKS